MSLLTMAMEDVVMLEKKRVPDGEGGFTTDWAEGVQFKAAISFDSSMEARTAEKEEFGASFDFQASMQARVAEKQGVTGLWNILVKKETRLEFHNIFKRLSDGQTFRVTSKDDKATPKSAGLDLRLISAEECTLE